MSQSDIKVQSIKGIKGWKKSENDTLTSRGEDNKSPSLCSLEKYNLDNIKCDDENKIVLTARSFDNTPKNKFSKSPSNSEKQRKSLNQQQQDLQKEQADLNDIIQMQEDPNCIRIHYDILNDPQLEVIKQHILSEALDAFDTKIRIQKTEQMQKDLEKQQTSQNTKQNQLKRFQGDLSSQKMVLKQEFLKQEKNQPQLNQVIINKIVERTKEQQYQFQEFQQQAKRKSIINQRRNTMADIQEYKRIVEEEHYNMRYNQKIEKKKKKDMEEQAEQAEYRITNITKLSSLHKNMKQMTQKQYLRDVNTMILHNLFMDKIKAEIQQIQDQGFKMQSSQIQQENNKSLLSHCQQIEYSQEIQTQAREILNSESRKFKDLMQSFKNVQTFKNPGLTVTSKDLINNVVDIKDQYQKKSLKQELQELTQNQEYFEQVEKRMIQYYQTYKQDIQHKKKQIDSLRQECSDLQDMIKQKNEDIKTAQYSFQEKTTKIQIDYFKNDPLNQRRQFIMKKKVSVSSDSTLKFNKNRTLEQQIKELQEALVEEVELKEKQIDEMNHKFQLNSEELDIITKQLEIVKIQKMRLNGMLKEHYIDRLQCDPKIAKLSLVWLIKVLRKLGESEIHHSLFPDILDFKNIQFLHDLAMKEEQMEDLIDIEFELLKKQQHKTPVYLSEVLMYDKDDLKQAIKSISSKKYSEQPNGTGGTQEEIIEKEQEEFKLQKSLKNIKQESIMNRQLIEKEQNESYLFSVRNQCNKTLDEKQFESSISNFYNGIPQYIKGPHRLVKKRKNIDYRFLSNQPSPDANSRITTNQSTPRLLNNPLKEKLLNQTIFNNTHHNQLQQQNIDKTSMLQNNNTVFSPNSSSQDYDKVITDRDIQKNNVESSMQREKMRQILKVEIQEIKNQEFIRMANQHLKEKDQKIIDSLYKIFLFLFGQREGMQFIEQFEKKRQNIQEKISRNQVYIFEPSRFSNIPKKQIRLQEMYHKKNNQLKSFSFKNPKKPQTQQYQEEQKNQNIHQQWVKQHEQYQKQNDKILESSLYAFELQELKSQNEQIFKKYSQLSESNKNISVKDLKNMQKNIPRKMEYNGFFKNMYSSCNIQDKFKGDKLNIFRNPLQKQNTLSNNSNNKQQRANKYIRNHQLLNKVEPQLSTYVCKSPFSKQQKLQLQQIEQQKQLNSSSIIKISPKKVFFSDNFQDYCFQ